MSNVVHDLVFKINMVHCVHVLHNFLFLVSLSLQNDAQKIEIFMYKMALFYPTYGVIMRDKINSIILPKFSCHTKF